MEAKGSLKQAAARGSGLQNTQSAPFTKPPSSDISLSSLDCLFLPYNMNDNRTPKLQRVPLEAKEAWDGQPFLEYPLRRGRRGMYFGGGSTTQYPWEMQSEANETPKPELRAFFQEWLFFGLIIEALDGNSEVTNSSDLSAQQQASDQPTQLTLRVYQDYIYIFDNKYYVTTAPLLAQLHHAWPDSEIAASLTPGATRDRLVDRCERMSKCLQMAYYFYTHLPRDFPPNIKFSIGAAAETIAHTLRHVCFCLKTKAFAQTRWGDGYYQIEEVESRMLNGGWCKSDLVRIMNKFKFLPTFHYFSFLDKKNAAKDHRLCNDSRCLAGADDESQNHLKDGCTCGEVEVELNDIAAALHTRDGVPLIAFKDPSQSTKSTQFDTETFSTEEELAVKVVNSVDARQYVAISHIWSDGLRNNKRNAINACKLRELRRVIQALTPSAITVAPGEKCPLFWLDAFCCPVVRKNDKRRRDDKKLALKKMRQVYEQAYLVLVLDATLQSYSTASMDLVEVLARIATSRWLTRVWTLQEGALAKRLWFQFADKALSFTELQARSRIMSESPNNVHQRVILLDIAYEISRIQQSLWMTEDDDIRGSTLTTLDEALLHRGTTHSSDEPLCIGSLMGLPAEAILEVGDDILTKLEDLNENTDLQHEETDRLWHSLQDQLRDVRMATVWKLLAEKFQSLPAAIIFFQETRLNLRGCRWAPQSLLKDQQLFHSPALRQVNWKDKKPGVITDKGLQVSYPGFRLYLKQYSHEGPRNPWKGCNRIPEDGIYFRDLSSGEWYVIGLKEDLTIMRDGSTATKSSAFPLHDFMHQHSKREGSSTEVFLLMSDIGQSQSETPNSKKQTVEGILAIGTFDDKATTPRPILANIQHHVIVGTASDTISDVYNVVEEIAMGLRTEESTRKFVALRDRGPDDGEYKVALEALKKKMQDATADALNQHPTLKTAIKKFWDDEEMVEYVWVWIGDWFNHGFLGEKIGENQVWIVD